MPHSHSLERVQRWLQAVITHPNGVGAGIASPDAVGAIEIASDGVDQFILPSSRMSSLDRLQIYGRAYFGRLLECLRAQFPAVRHAVGPEAFDGFAFGYLIEHPSSTYTLASLGEAFDEYLAASRPPRVDSQSPNEPDFADFLIELARLERIYSEVFDGPGPESSRSLQAVEIAGLSAETFSNCRLILHECVKLLELRFAVHEYASAVRQETEPMAPVARPLYLVVARRDYKVRRFEVNRQQFELLLAIQKQATIGEALIRLRERSDFDVGTLGTNLRLWFEEWSAIPLFASLQLENGSDRAN